MPCFMAGPNVPPPQKNKGLIAGLIKGHQFFFLVFWGQRTDHLLIITRIGRHMDKQTPTDAAFASEVNSSDLASLMGD